MYLHMIFCFSGTGNSRYIARRFAEALQDTIIDLNAKIKAQDNSLIQTGQDVIIVVPTYAWRIPRVVSEWLTKTQLTSAERIWFVMDCGSEIGNAAKYAMPHTRVYVKIAAEDGDAVFQMKNVSANELTFNPEEITERFVRGDSSRNTEGSGLGLAIAKSFAQLQHGNLKITTEADLFKAEIILPKLEMSEKKED